MALSLFGKARGQASLEDLIRRKQYAKAVELLKVELHKRRRDRSLRLKLADVLALAGRVDEAVGLLHGLADELALGGFAAQAIALLKRVQALAPGRAEVEEKLAYLITQQSRPAPDPWALARPRTPTEASPALPELGMEELSDDEIGLFDGPPAEASANGGPAVEPESAGHDAEQISDQALGDELVGLIEAVFRPDEPLPAPDRRVETPLFRDFSPEELADVIRAFKLRRFEAGEILVSEGEPGQSLFVLTAGRVRAFVRDAQGRNVEVRQLVEGDFFGEAAVLTGKARSATLTAATDCELLELERARLDELSQKKPRIWNVLLEFHKARRDNTLESLIRGRA